MKAKKKPVVIDYYPIEYTIKNGSELPDWVRSFGDNVLDHFIVDINTKTIKVKTLEGISYIVTDEDVIIRGVKGEYYPCKKDIFEQTYEKIEDNGN